MWIRIVRQTGLEQVMAKIQMRYPRRRHPVILGTDGNGIKLKWNTKAIYDLLQLLLFKIA